MEVQNRKNIKMISYMAGPVVAAVVLAAVFCGFYGRRRSVPAPESVVIAVPYSEWVQDYETNYYTGWLEEKTGYDITFVYMDEGYERESLNAMLTAENSGVDAIFLPAGQDLLSPGEYQAYIKDGCLAAPQDQLADDSRLEKMEETYAGTDFDGLFGEDGRFYCFPSLDMARTGHNMQILWINIDWLTNLHLTIPATTEEFEKVLREFKKGDPNGNGKADELPLISCEAEAFFQSYRYLLNAFTYYDGAGLPQDADWEQKSLREGIAYCASLYKQGLLADDCFLYTKKQLMELVNDPADMVGAFASHSIADVVYTNNPGILAHFVQLAPLSSGSLKQGCAVYQRIDPSIGGLIPARAAHKEAAAQIMDLMLSDEASLIARYGEEGADWRFSKDGELSTYGTRARVTTIRYLPGERQNQNYAGVGPLAAAAEYADGVTWNGDHSMTEYIDARAVKAYEPYYASRSGETSGDGAERVKHDNGVISQYLEHEILQFITGERDIESDRDWERFLTEYGRLAE